MTTHQPAFTNDGRRIQYTPLPLQAGFQVHCTQVAAHELPAAPAPATGSFRIRMHTTGFGGDIKERTYPVGMSYSDAMARWAADTGASIASVEITVATGAAPANLATPVPAGQVITVRQAYKANA